MKKGFICFLFIFSSSLFAKEPDALLQAHLTKYEHPIEDQFYSSFWAGCNTSKKSPKVEHIIKFTDKTPFYKTEKTKAVAYLHDHKKKIDSMVVYIPGVFVNFDQAASKSMVRRFLKNRQHVMYFPNPIGTDHINAGFRGAPGNFMKEAKAFYLIFKKFLSDLKSKGFDINNIKIAGGSYGALIAAIMLEMDSRDSKLINQVTLFSPPFNFLRSFERLDKYIDVLQNQYSLFPLSSNLITALKGCKVRKLSQKKLDKLAGIVIYHGIQSSLVDSVFAYEKHMEIDLTPGSFFGWIRTRYRNWRREVKTIPLISTHMIDFKKYFKLPYVSLKHWLDKAKENNPKIDLLVITTEDDFINDLYSIPNDSNYVIFKNGGHLGYYSLPWFDKLFELRFRDEGSLN